VGELEFDCEYSRRAREPPLSPRHPTPFVLGGSLHRAPNGDLATIQTTPIATATPLAIRQIWASVTSRLHPKAWDGIEPEGYMVIWWTPSPTLITCGHCRRAVGRFVAYHAGTEYGVVPAHAKRDRLTGRRDTPSTDPRFSLSGETGRTAAKTFLEFTCPRCSQHYNRNLARLGRMLWDTRPETYPLEP
jgi:hypothetical protein